MSRGTRDVRPRREKPFAYRAITFFGRPFQALRLDFSFLTPRQWCVTAQRTPTTPAVKRTHAITYDRFELFPFRSPLLRESRLLSLPRGTKMFQFPRFASRPYGFRPG